MKKIKTFDEHRRAIVLSIIETIKKRYNLDPEDSEGLLRMMMLYEQEIEHLRKQNIILEKMAESPSLQHKKQDFDEYLSQN